MGLGSARQCTDSPADCAGSRCTHTPRLLVAEGVCCASRRWATSGPSCLASPPRKPYAPAPQSCSFAAHSATGLKGSDAPVYSAALHSSARTEASAKDTGESGGLSASAKVTGEDFAFIRGAIPSGVPWLATGDGGT